MSLIDKYLGEMNEDQLHEINKRKFEMEIKKNKRNKNRLQNLRSTIQSMGDGGMLSQKDVSDLMDKISTLM